MQDKKKKKIQIHVLILSSFYLNTDVFTPVSVTLYENARLDFFPPTLKLYLLFRER